MEQEKMNKICDICGIEIRDSGTVKTDNRVTFDCGQVEHDTLVLCRKCYKKIKWDIARRRKRYQNTPRISQVMERKESEDE